MSRYPKPPYLKGEGSQVLSRNAKPTPVGVRPDLPGTVIVVHGVNDVGTSYEAVEQGLCLGLSERLGWGRERMPFRPATYRMPTPDDRQKLEPDPDAVFFKRQVEPGTHSMVIPFYWGFREESGQAIPGEKTPHGQHTDRHGNRLDLDFSKGGGPFANATTTLVDMWNRGAPRVYRALDRAAHDPLRPVLAGPGRMYMVLAAQRLAALIAMIRDYDPKETVNVVAHSQGCLVTLLAQAFLMNRPGCRPADTLILTHPPYSLAEPALEAALAMAAGWADPKIGGGVDARMKPHYGSIEGSQTLRARLDTLINIVGGVHANRSTWKTDDLVAMRSCGIHSARWEASQDRDNRGKVYLYFCPEDMTVALDSVQGIGWQGVPHEIHGRTIAPTPEQITDAASGVGFGTGRVVNQPVPIQRHPLKELGAGFLQRVFTAKKRIVAGQSAKVPFPVGLPPQDFVLRQPVEDDHDHVVEDQRTLRATLPAGYMTRGAAAPARDSLRFISGEPLHRSVTADLYAGSVGVGSLKGAAESVDPIDAAIATTSEYGAERAWALLAGIANDPHPVLNSWSDSPAPTVHPGLVRTAPEHRAAAQKALVEQPHGHGRQVQETYLCLHREGRFGAPTPTGQILVAYLESPDEIRLRQQRSTSARSFHGAIIGSARNHANVTAYDVAINQGLAVSDPAFYGYLCAVADWRLKKPSFGETKRLGILIWNQFIQQYGTYWAVDRQNWRKGIIEGNCDYYSTGALPEWLPLITDLPSAVISESLGQNQVEKHGQEKKRPIGTTQ